MEPYAVGGSATEENIELRCRAHNAYEARLFFGADIVREERAWWVDSFQNELIGPLDCSIRACPGRITTHGATTVNRSRA